MMKLMTEKETQTERFLEMARDYNCTRWIALVVGSSDHHLEDTAIRAAFLFQVALTTAQKQRLRRLIDHYLRLLPDADREFARTKLEAALKYVQTWRDRPATNADLFD